jgi:hypothetical protein
MRKIIEGKIYDTNTATEIGTWSNNLSTRDFRNETTTLYITKKGNFFMAGESGPMGSYAYSVGNGTSGGEGMFALTKEEALEWAERHLEAKEYEEYFKDIIEEA